MVNICIEFDRHGWQTYIIENIILNTHVIQTIATPGQVLSRQFPSWDIF